MSLDYMVSKLPLRQNCVNRAWMQSCRRAIPSKYSFQGRRKATSLFFGIKGFLFSAAIGFNPCIALANSTHQAIEVHPSGAMALHSNLPTETGRFNFLNQIGSNLTLLETTIDLPPAGESLNQEDITKIGDFIATRLQGDPSEIEVMAWRAVVGTIVHPELRKAIQKALNSAADSSAAARETAIRFNGLASKIPVNGHSLALPKSLETIEVRLFGAPENARLPQLIDRLDTLFDGQLKNQSTAVGAELTPIPEKKDPEAWGLSAFDKDGPAMQAWRLDAQVVLKTGGSDIGVYWFPVDGQRVPARNAGLDGFIRTKTELENGRSDIFLEELPYIFDYLDTVLAPYDAWSAPIRRKLAVIRNMPNSTNDEKRIKNQRLNAYVTEVTGKLDADLDATVPGRIIPLDRIPLRHADAPKSIQELSLTPAPGTKFTPSPDWSKTPLVYSLFFDRFNQDESRSGWHHEEEDLTDPRTWHLGTIRGVIEKLDYLYDLGVRVIQFNPWLGNFAYHGYWIYDFLGVDPHLGTMADLKELFRELHKRGMYGSMDVVINHAAPVIHYPGGHRFGARRRIEFKHPIYPVELRNPEHFHGRGEIGDWEHASPDEMNYGDLPGGVPSINNDNPETMAMFAKILKWWIKELDLDGLRWDSMSHVKPESVQWLFADIRKFCAEVLGKTNILNLGEIYNGDPSVIRDGISPERLTYAYNYPGYFWLVNQGADFSAPDGIHRGSLHGWAPTRSIEVAFRYLTDAMGSAIHSLLNFVSNQDKPRFLKEDEPLGALKFSEFIMFTSPGIPLIFQGTEQGHRYVENRKWAGMDGYREDMYGTGQFRNPHASEKAFDVEHPMYQWIRKLSLAREKFTALQKGTQHFVWSDPNGPGIIAYTRVYQDQQILAVGNSAADSRSATMFIDPRLAPEGTVLRDSLHPEYNVTVGANGEVNVEVPRHGGRILAISK